MSLYHGDLEKNQEDNGSLYEKDPARHSQHISSERCSLPPVSGPDVQISHQE